jgi:hypothetical protein
VQLAPALTHWILQGLIRAGSEAIERHGKASYFEFGHQISFAGGEAVSLMLLFSIVI